MTNIRLFRGKEAVKEIKRLKIDDVFLYQWYIDQGVYCYIRYLNSKPAAFALISRMNFDPLDIHKNPKMLNYVYTLPEYRRRGYATELVTHIIGVTEFSAFCSNEESEKLFEKCNCTNHGIVNNAVMFRYPQ
ncbi:hypothetical protein PPYR_15051 [Photinus pyralis]|uniref:N-acetyltransferase domain-containing protein n=1 Tax=Photinus pyralis TaxID=7054 RepID=A0A5N3ZZQ9_PHOPY|nr:hypothetical protein PPYR_15051 [Photinus pyralis]